MKQFRPSQGFAYSNYKQKRFNKVAKALGVEKKYVDYIYGSTDVAQTIAAAEADPATQKQLSGVPIGDGARSRDGRCITIKSIHINGVITSYTPNDRVVRIALVKDTQTNGVQLEAQNVFQSAGGVGNDINTFRNLDYVKRFQVLKDLTFDINTGFADAGAISTMKHFSINVPMNMEVNHILGGDTVADVTDNSLHLLAWTNGNDVTLNYVVRTRFVG